jgi:hypothetical protein
MNLVGTEARAYYAKMPDETVIDMRKGSKKQSHWNFYHFGLIMRVAYLRALHPAAWITLLWSKEVELSAQRKCLPSVRPDALSRMLTSVSAEEVSRIPRHDQAYKVAWQYTFGLHGDVILPERIRFGWDFRHALRDGLRLIRVTDGGQLVYKDAKGVIHSEGHPLPIHPVVSGWGSPSLIVWMTSENSSELLPYWHNPPRLCPWHWYSRFGNGLYEETGLAKNYDPKLRPPVTWLERTM